MYSQNVYIAGAGISLGSPANFPIANHIIEEIFNYIAPNMNIRDELLNFSRKDHNNRLKGDYIRFELLMDVISGIDEKLEILNFVSNYDKPNRNHYYLAQAAINGDKVITPNFDDLIERAIIDLGYYPISICYDKDFKLSNTMFSNKQVPVYKIHGSYYKHQGFNNKVKASKETMQASLTSISSSNALFSLSNQKFSCFEFLIKNSKQLIIVGYSGCDDFDIIPSLIKVNPENIHWVQHADCIDYSNKILDIVDKNIDKGNDLISERDRFLINQYKKGIPSLNYHETNTLEYLSNCLNNDDINKKNIPLLPPDDSFKIFMKEWACRFIDNETKVFLSAELFYRLSDYEKAYSLYNEISTKSTLYLKSKLSSIASLLKRSKFNAAKSILDKTFSTSIDSKEEYCKFLEQKAYCAANISEERLEIENVKHLFSIAIEECRKYKQLSTLSTGYNDYALFLRDIGDLSNAMVYYRRSVKLANKTGNLRHQAWVYFNMACIYFDKGQYKKSLEYNLKSKEITNSSGDYQHMCNIENLNGVNYLLLGRMLESIKAIRKSIYMEYSQDNELNSTVDWLTLGQVFFELGRVKTSLRCYNKSFELFQYCDDKTYLHELIFFRCILYIENGEIKKAESQSAQINHLNTKREHLLSEIIKEIVNPQNSKCISEHLSELLEINEITLFLNSVFHFTLLNLDSQIIGIEHLIYSLNVYKRNGNIRRYEIIKNHIKTRHNRVEPRQIN